MRHKKLIVAIPVAFIFVIAFSVFALPSTLWQKRIEEFRSICVHEAYAMITYKSNQTYMVILDARTPAEFDTSHIADAINIPYDQLEAHLGDPALTGHQNDLILVYCSNGTRSAIASEILYYGGFTNVYNVVGGITQWRNPVWNYPVVVGTPAVYTNISVTDAFLMITSGSPTYGKSNLIVDVRYPAEYNAGHVVNSTSEPVLHALSIPWADLINGLLGPLSGHEYDSIIVYCQNSSYCDKARSACQYLVDHGFRKVYLMGKPNGGGMDAWKAAGYPTASTPSPVYLFSDGFESGSFSAWTGKSVTPGNTLVGSSAEKHDGTYSCHAVCAGGTRASPYKTLLSSYETLCMRMYVRFAVDLVSGSSGIILMKMADNSGNGIFNLRVRKQSSSNYVLEVGNYANSLNPYSSTSAPFSIGVNTWYCVELQGHIGSGTGWFKALWDGDTKIDQSNQNTGTTQIQRVNVGVEYCWLSNPCDIYVDCVAVSDNPIGLE